MIKNDKIQSSSYSTLKGVSYEKAPDKSDSTNKDVKPKQLTEKQQQEVVSQLLAATGGIAPIPSYGKGETIASGSVDATKVGQVKIGDGKNYAIGETALLEARARTYVNGPAIGAEAQGSLVRAEYGAKGSTSLVNDGKTEIVGVGGHVKGEGFVGGQVNTEAGVGIKGILPYAGASAAAFAGARVGVDAGGEARVVGVGVRADGSANAWAGAQGNVDGNVTLGGINAGAEGYAGAGVGVDGRVSVGGIGVKAGADAYAGIGGKAGINIGIDKDYDIHVGAEAGGAFGLGSGLGFEVSIDAQQVYQDGKSLVTNVADLVNSGAQAGAQAGSNAANTAGDVVSGVVDAVEDTAQAAGNAASGAAHAAGNAAGNAASAVGNAIGSFFG